MTSATCSHCGQPLSYGALFCEYCGAAREASASSNVSDNPFRRAAQTQNIQDIIDPPIFVPANFLDAVKSCFDKYCVVKGRASRTEYWYWVLFVLLTSILPLYVAAYLQHETGDVKPPVAYRVFQATFLSWFLVCLSPTAALVARRWHDHNKSGGFGTALFATLVILLFIPYLNAVVFTVWGLLPGTRGANDYGRPPIRRNILPRGQITRAFFLWRVIIRRRVSAILRRWLRR